MNFQAIVASMRSELQAKKLLQSQLQTATSLVEKFILLRRAVNPQSTVPEAMIMSDLKIGRPLNETSGDGHKNGKNYEINASNNANDASYKWFRRH